MFRRRNAVQSFGVRLAATLGGARLRGNKNSVGRKIRPTEKFSHGGKKSYQNNVNQPENPAG